MTKLSGTSGQVFSSLAESLNMRGTSRSGKSAGAKAPADSSFNDLLHTVSNLAKRALNDGGSDTAVKAGTLRTRLAHQSGKDNASDEEEPGSNENLTEKSSDKKVDNPSGKHGLLDHTEQTDVQGRSSIAGIIGQESVAGPQVVMPQMQAPAGDKKGASGRDERSATTKRDVQAMGTSKATAELPSPVAPAAAHSQAATSHAGVTDQVSSRESSVPPTATAPGFEAIAANVERAAKASARDTLPGTTKVTVVQQETHLPPAQFNAPQQVANAVVAELKEAPAPTASAAPDLTTSQANSPDQPLKILTINLEPAALGNVTVRLRLVGNEVSVHLAAERKDTSQMLDQQRDSIRDLMQSAGYVADVAPVQHGSLDGFQSGSGQSQPQLSGQQQPSSQSQGTFDGTSNSSGQADGGAKQARQERQSNQETRHDQDVAPQTRRGPVYL
ncbi:chemotaxis protein MotD [Bradyrhizobium sp. i1.15.2]|uniref:flagellar hook-length control protein FliK n=1 Tax=Bradyrhizobium sp. i1.15.2 TaxID=3156362 RepID=UPI0033984178